MVCSALYTSVSFPHGYRRIYFRNLYPSILFPADLADFRRTNFRSLYPSICFPQISQIFAEPISEAFIRVFLSRRSCRFSQNLFPKLISECFFPADLADFSRTYFRSFYPSVSFPQISQILAEPISEAYIRVFVSRSFYICENLYLNFRFKHTTDICENLRNLRETLSLQPKNICENLIPMLRLKHTTDICENLIPMLRLKHTTDICENLRNLRETLSLQSKNISENLYLNFRFKHTTDICENLRNLRETLASVKEFCEKSR
jgi:hypothetical protein